jgi:subtilisin family serine protease
MGKMKGNGRILLGFALAVVLMRPVQSEALDYYYYGGKPVILQRDPSFIGVDFAVVGGPALAQSFRSPDGLVAVEEVVVELPHPGRFVCRIKSLPNAGAAPSPARSLALDPRVQRTYPVFRNPKTGLLVFVFDEIIVRLRPGVGQEDLLRFGAARGIQIVERNSFEPDIFLLRVARRDGSALDAANEYALSGLCLWAEPNFGGEIRKSAAGDPNDPYYFKQWHLNNTGQSGGIPDADVDAPEAWAITSGSAQVVIALMDDGIDMNHEDLKANIFANPGESGGGRETNHIDDDGNGFVDDVHGWDFFDDDNNPDHDFRSGSLEGHGTATAGIAGAVGNNGIGVTGIAPRCRILPIKIFKGNDFASNYQVANAIRYAAKFADVLSNSWGGGVLSQTIDSAIFYAIEKGRSGRGCPVFFASGNDSTSEVSYPGSNLWTVAVGATDASDRRFMYSNYGFRLTLMSPSGSFTTDLSGLGAGYDSGSPDTTGNYTGVFGGTSSACPLAAGTAALLLSLNPSLSALQVQTILQRTADKILPSVAQYNIYGFSLQYGYGRINAYQALNRVKQGGALMDDQLEPNNTRSAARLIDKGFYSGLAALDDDWYATDVSPYQDIVVQIYFIHSRGDLQLELYNPSGVLVASSAGTTNTEQVERNVGATGGRWSFRVFGKSAAKNYYHLIVNKRPPDDSFEQNDTLATAKTIGPGDYNSLRGYDPDYFRVRVRSGQKLTAVIRFYHELGDLDLYLLDSSGTVVSESANVSSVEGVWYHNTGPDADFFIFVNNYADCENAYQMHVEVGPGQDDSFEENDTRSAAALILPGAYHHLQPYDYDWYKIAVGPRQILETEIRFVHGVGDLDLDLFNAAGQVVDRSEGSADIERVIFVNTNNTAAYAYPVVYPYGAGCPDYDLTVSLTSLADDTYEPNNDLSHSARIVAGRTYSDLVALDNDFYGVQVQAGKTLAAFVADEESLPRLGLAIYTPSGAPLASSVNGQPTLVVARQVPVTGTYRLGVSLPSGAKVNLYALGTLVYDAPTTPTTSEDRFEPNDSWATRATPVVQGAYADLFCANDDFFMIQLDAGDSLYVGIVFNDTRGDLDLALYDSWGQQLDLSAGSDQNTELCVVGKAPATGLYYIRVFPSWGNSWYDLLIGRSIYWTKGLLGAKHWTYY